MAGAKEKTVAVDANEAALKNYEEGVRRSIKQADAGLVQSGLVQSFKTKEEFLNHLKNLE